MFLIVLFSFLLLAGMAVSQTVDLANARQILSTVTMLCLAYIMVDVGLEFTVDKSKPKAFAWDFCVALSAAVLPALLWIGYFMFFFHPSWNNVLLAGLSTAPTSAGVLFSMLLAAGLGTTWVFQKARVLAVFDDLATILLLIPVQILLVGFKLELIVVVIMIIVLLLIAFYGLDQFHWPAGRGWLFLYSGILVGLLTVFEHAAHIHFPVLLPAFALGCLLYKSHTQSPRRWEAMFDQCLKGLFMFLVGCSLPKVDFAGLAPALVIAHVIALTILSNIGKCFPMLCYRKQAGFKDRMALSIAMFPRGEVGAGVLLIAISFGFTGPVVSLAVLSLALNLLLTGIFVTRVNDLLKKDLTI